MHGRLWWNPFLIPLMRQVPKTELSPDNGCVVDTKWKVGPLTYHSCATEVGARSAGAGMAQMPEIVVYDHVGFRGAYARTNLSFLYLGDFWNDRISSLIIVSGIWRFYRDEYYKGDIGTRPRLLRVLLQGSRAGRRGQFVPGN